MMGENENLLSDSMSEMTKICEEFISLKQFLISQTGLKTDFSKLIVQDQFLKTALTTAFSKSITQTNFQSQFQVNYHLQAGGGRAVILEE